MKTMDTVEINSRKKVVTKASEKRVNTKGTCELELLAMLLDEVKANMSDNSEQIGYSFTVSGVIKGTRFESIAKGMVQKHKELIMYFDVYGLDEVCIKDFNKLVQAVVKYPVEKENSDV